MQPTSVRFITLTSNERICTAENKESSIDWVVALRLTRHKIGHFENVPKPISWLGMEKKTKPNTTKAHIHHLKEMHYNYNTKWTEKKLKSGLVVSYDIRPPGNGEGLF